MQHVCKESFSVKICDGDGFSTDEYFNIEVGDVFKIDNVSSKVVGGPNSVRLENDNCWIEITPEHFEQYFTVVEES